MNMKCIVVDDEPLARKGLQQYIQQIDFLQLVGVFEDAAQVYPQVHELDVDLIFLDIEMPRLTGIQFMRSLKHPPLVIFITAYPDYAVEGYELDVTDYLLKPVSFPRFVRAVNKAHEIVMSRQHKPTVDDAIDHFFVKENGRFTKVMFDDVLYLEALQNYVAIHLQGKKIISYITLTTLEKQLPANLFMRIHKSYIVPLQRVVAIEGNMALVGSVNIPVSRKLKDKLMQEVVDRRLLKR